MSYNPYGKNPGNNIHIDTQGTEFEQTVIAIMKKTLPRGLKFQSTLSSKDDIEQGTDAVCGEVRIDLTSNFTHKNYMPYIQDTGIPATRFTNFKMGVRHGNHHDRAYHPFDEPVVVIGVDMTPREFYRNQDEIEANVKKYAEELIAKADDTLLDYTTTDPEERKELVTQPLEPNPLYRRPKNIPDRYKRFEEARERFAFLEDGDLADIRLQTVTVPADEDER